MWMLSAARISNIFSATPACERIPTPTTDTFDRFSSALIWSAGQRSAQCFVSSSFARARSLPGNVKVRFVRPFWMCACTITSTTMPAWARGRSTLAWIPGWSTRADKVTLASSRVAVTPETTTASMDFSSGTTQVPSLSLKLDRT